MNTLQELVKQRKKMLSARSGSVQIQSRINILISLTGEERQRFADNLKGYIEALFENNLMTFQDAKDLESIVESQAKGLH